MAYFFPERTKQKLYKKNKIEELKLTKYKKEGIRLMKPIDNN